MIGARPARFPASRLRVLKFRNLHDRVLGSLGHRHTIRVDARQITHRLTRRLRLAMTRSRGVVTFSMMASISGPGERLADKQRFDDGLDLVPVPTNRGRTFSRSRS